LLNYLLSVVVALPCAGFSFLDRIYWIIRIFFAFPEERQKVQSPYGEEKIL